MKTNRPPYTRAQLDVMIPKVKAQLAADEAAAIEDGIGEINGMPPMTKDEALDYLARLMDAGQERLLTRHECFMHGQLMAVFEMAIRAEMLGKKGRYLVVSEEQVFKLTGEKSAS